VPAEESATPALIEVENVVKEYDHKVVSTGSLDRARRDGLPDRRLGPAGTLARLLVGLEGRRRDGSVEGEDAVLGSRARPVRHRFAMCSRSTRCSTR
jgi:hypothetical protein